MIGIKAATTLRVKSVRLVLVSAFQRNYNWWKEQFVKIHYLGALRLGTTKKRNHFKKKDIIINLLFPGQKVSQYTFNETNSQKAKFWPFECFANFQSYMPDSKTESGAELAFQQQQQHSKVSHTMFSYFCNLAIFAILIFRRQF